MPCMASAITFFRRLHFQLVYRQTYCKHSVITSGAHTFERTDKPRGEFFHTNWTGRGGNTASTTYDV